MIVVLSARKPTLRLTVYIMRVYRPLCGDFYLLLAKISCFVSFKILCIWAKRV